MWTLAWPTATPSPPTSRWLHQHELGYQREGPGGHLYASEQAGFGKVPNEDVIDRFFDEAQVALSS